MDILHNLNSKQQEAVQITDGPVLVLAGAGTGKTRTLAHRIAHLIHNKGVAPHRILAVTFTNKAAKEMMSRVYALVGGKPITGTFFGVSDHSPLVSTFHSLGARIMREHAPKIGYQSSFSIYDEEESEKAIKEVMKMRGISKEEYNPRSFLFFIDRAKQDMVGHDRIQEVIEHPSSVFVERLVEVYTYYEQYLHDNNALDFGDLLCKPIALWQKHPNVLAEYQKRWEYILVDEYQDTNTVQYEFCRLLSLAHRNLFVVGDDYQSIYSFRGASVHNILSFTKQYHDAKVVVLEQNYRSVLPILHLANSLIKNSNLGMKKVLWSTKESTDVPYIVEVGDEYEEAEFVVRVMQGHFPYKEKDDDVRYEYETDEEEPVGILDRIMAFPKVRARKSAPSYDRKKTREFSYDAINLNGFVVLYRTNAQSRAIEEVLLHHRIPYRIIGGVRFYERREIKDIIAYLRFLVNPRDIFALTRIINSPPRGIGKKTKEQFIAFSRAGFPDYFSACKAAAKSGADGKAVNARIHNFCMLIIDLFHTMQTASPAEFIGYIVAKSGYAPYCKEHNERFEEVMANIKELQSVASQYKEEGIESMQKFLEHVSLTMAEDEKENEKNALTLMTIHAAKGLEFDTVFLVGMEQGLFPHMASLANPHELEEERRLCYVALTRAREQLFLTYARQRNRFGGAVYPEPSEFLRDLDAQLVKKVVL